MASESVRVLGAVFSVHSTLREARICYLRALVSSNVFFIHDQGLTESIVKADIPSGLKLKSWWSLCWREWDGDERIAVPSIRP